MEIKSIHQFEYYSPSHREYETSVERIFCDESRFGTDGLKKALEHRLKSKSVGRIFIATNAGIHMMDSSYERDSYHRSIFLFVVQLQHLLC